MEQNTSEDNNNNNNENGAENQQKKKEESFDSRISSSFPGGNDNTANTSSPLQSSPHHRHTRSKRLSLQMKLYNRITGHENGIDANSPDSFGGISRGVSSPSAKALKRSSSYGCGYIMYASTKSKHSSFGFELCPWHPKLRVKSAKLKHGSLVLGQHRTIKLRADSRQEAESWVRVLNQKGMLHSQCLQDLTMRARMLTSTINNTSTKSYSTKSSTSATSVDSDSSKDKNTGVVLV